MSHGNTGTPCVIKSVDIVTGAITGVLDYGDTIVRNLIDSEPESCFMYNGKIYLAGRRGVGSSGVVWGNNRIVEIDFN